jgi:acetate kinase
VNVLVLNAGSSTQKSRLYRLEDGTPPPNAAPAPVWKSDTRWKPEDEDRRPEAMAAMLRTLWEGNDAPLNGPGDIHAIGHRVVHGGRDLRDTTRVTPAVRETIARLAPLAPAHNPAALEGIKACRAVFGEAMPQFAAFDTAFHATIPDAAARYGLPPEWGEERDVRRYGFHGISHRYVSERAARVLGRAPASLRLITCHLGNGCSLCAVRGGVSVDTTMGFTPMEGLVMGTRSGSLDPGAVLYLLRQEGMTVDRLDTLLNKESGLKGLSGVSGDMREVSDAAAGGNERAQFALDVFAYRVRWHIGAMAAALDGLDALVFTAGIGENSATIRAAVCEGLGFLGVRLDPAKNARTDLRDEDVSASDARARTLVIQTEEDWAIARECWTLLRQSA